MKLKNSWKRFWTLDRHHAAGFTLVELIVVIAILAILAGVGIPVYSGYIKKANMGVDQTMVSELVRSLELAAILDPDAFPADATIYLSTGNAKTSGTDAAKLDTILANAYGSGFKSQLKLKYGQWGLGETITTYAKELNTTLSGMGTDVKLSYTDDVDELWDEVENILTGLESTETMDKAFGGSAGLMASAADYTLNRSDNPITQADFATMWANPNDDFTGYSQIDFNPDSTDKSAGTLTPMLARYAAIKGRNYTFGNWLAGKPEMTAIANEIKDASTGEQAASVAIPRDFMDIITGSAWGTSHDAAHIQALAGYVNEYFGVSGYMTAKPSENVSGKYFLVASGAVTPNTACQAYTDALGYYTLMQAVDSSAADTKGMSNEEYRNTMADAVHNVGALLNNPDVLTDVEGGCVAITVKKAQDGSIKYYITPASIYAGGSTVQSGVGQSTAALKNVVNVTVNLNMTTVADGSFVLNAGQTGTMHLSLSQEFTDAVEGEGGTADAVLTDMLSNLSWSSNNAGIATANGTTVTAIAKGQAVLTGDMDGITITITVNVV